MEERCANDNLEIFGPANDVVASQQTDAGVLEDVICDLVIDQKYIF